MRRLTPGQVRVSDAGLRLGSRRGRDLAWTDVAGVDVGEGASELDLLLRTGERVHLAFAPERPVIERDVFVARVRARLGAAAAARVPLVEPVEPPSALAPSLVDPGA